MAFISCVCVFACVVPSEYFLRLVFYFVFVLALASLVLTRLKVPIKMTGRPSTDVEKVAPSMLMGETVCK